ncbi:Sodium-coupled monocarboxylate transporter [Saliniradius amylolyticus]|uniref:Sodium-coupled monocarboxylate transporter n=1 Tax=Saliniradius amylolyticus TaxID=2183582 RepID=A0A2S2E682_9ALTE|nr:sodium:solute symporter [Saliniradius amylolyticus]AWL13109.1 Sodium-coupled monocarboxylate transporter [Saliniradius amylolyticus]
MQVQFFWQDWLVFLGYFAVMAFTGWYFSRKQSATTQDYFLGGNSMPIWMVAVSVLATSQSAATFLGGPDQGYQGDFSYLATNIGAALAAVGVAWFLIPKFYQLRVTTVYELLEERFGQRAKKQAGLMYLFGRVFASGARLYMAAIAVSMILFANIEATNVISSVLILAVVGLAYSFVGGIRSVIYSDVIQTVVYVGAAIFVIAYLLSAIPADFGEIIHALQNPPERELSKLTLLDFRLDFTSSGVFTFWSAVTGFLLLNIAAFGLDQDMSQRMLSCKNAKEGAKALIWSVVMVIPVMALFIAIGLLLYIYYQRPELMTGGGVLEAAPSFNGEDVTIFMYYVLNEIPPGIRGLVTVGVIAAALSTLNSGLNAMSSVLVQDLYRPWVEKHHPGKEEKHFVFAGQMGMVVAAAALGGMAILCYFWQQYSEMPLLAFALSVMVFSYCGLLGVYFTTLFTRRGSASSVTAALLVGFMVPLLMQPYIQTLYLPQSLYFNLGFTYQLCLGSLIAFLVCFAGRQQADVLVNETAGSELTR